jgi:hypothetical protein
MCEPNGLDQDQLRSRKASLSFDAEIFSLYRLGEQADQIEQKPHPGTSTHGGRPVNFFIPRLHHLHGWAV